MTNMDLKQAATSVVNAIKGGNPGVNFFPGTMLEGFPFNKYVQLDYKGNFVDERVYHEYVESDGATIVALDIESIKDICHTDEQMIGVVAMLLRLAAQGRHHPRLGEMPKLMKQLGYLEILGEQYSARAEIEEDPVKKEFCLQIATKCRKAAEAAA